MNLVREKWTEEDGKDFQKYIESLKKPLKEGWTSNILNTNMKVLAISTPEVKAIVKNILKGNYLSFLDLNLHEYYDNIAINGFIISCIKDFDVLKKYLNIYVNYIDNWSGCDLLSFNIDGNEEKYWNLALKYIKSKKTFIRRTGIVIIFNFVKIEKYIDKIFLILDSFEKEEEYYVNMINAWLLCECFIKHRNKTLKYLENNKLNNFVINKGIQKCRDSHRVTKVDKDLLLKYKRK